MYLVGGADCRVDSGMCQPSGVALKAGWLAWCSEHKSGEVRPSPESSGTLEDPHDIRRTWRGMALGVLLGIALWGVLAIVLWRVLC